MQHLLLPEPGAQLHNCSYMFSKKNKSIKAGSIFSSYTQLQLLRLELPVHLYFFFVEEKKKDRRLEEKFDLLSSSNTLCESACCVFFVLLDIFLKILFLKGSFLRLLFSSLPTAVECVGVSARLLPTVRLRHRHASSFLKKPDLISRAEPKKKTNFVRRSVLQVDVQQESGGRN